MSPQVQPEAPRRRESETFACETPSRNLIKHPTSLSTFNRLNEEKNTAPISNEGWIIDIIGNLTANKGVGDPAIIQLSQLWRRHSSCTEQTTDTVTTRNVEGITSSKAVVSSLGSSVISSIEATTSISFPGQLLNPRQVSTTTETGTGTLILTEFSMVTETMTEIATVTATMTKTEVTTLTKTQLITTISTVTRTQLAVPAPPTPVKGGNISGNDSGQTKSDESANPAKIIAPAVIAGLLGLFLLILFGYILVRRWQARHAARWEEKTQEELGDTWDARPMPAQTDNVQDLQIPDWRDPDSKHPPVFTESSTSLEPATGWSNSVILDDEASSRQEQGLSGHRHLITPPLVNLQTDDDQNEPTHGRANSQVRMLPTASDPAGSGQLEANMMISEILEELTSESRAEIQRVVASLSERRPSIQRQQGWSLRRSGVQSTSTHATAPPEYQE